MAVNVERNLRLFNDAMKLESYDKEDVKNFRKTLSTTDKAIFNYAVKVAEYVKVYNIEKSISQELKNGMALQNRLLYLLCSIKDRQRKVDEMLSYGFQLDGESDLFKSFRDGFLDLAETEKESKTILGKYREEFNAWYEKELKKHEAGLALKIVDEIKSQSSAGFLGFECSGGLQFIRKEIIEKVSAYWYDKNNSWNITIYEKKEPDDEENDIKTFQKYYTLKTKFANKEAAFFVANELMKLISSTEEPEEDEYKLLWDNPKSASNGAD